MKKITALFLLFISLTIKAQVGIGTNTPNSSAILDLTSTTKGFLPPRMTAIQRAAIVSPATGLLVYQTDSMNGLYFYDGSNWTFIIPTNITGNAATVTTNANLTGDVTSVGNATTIAAGAITNAKVSEIAASKITGTLPVANGGTGTSTGSITGTTALTLAAGGTNQNVIITPSGTGNSILNGSTVIGTSSPNGSAVLDVTSTTKGFLPPRMTFVQKNAISNPVAGLMIWCTDCGSKGQMQVYNGSTWTNVSGTAANHPTSNGTAVVAGYTCSTGTGAMIVGGAVSGVTQTITANITTVGTYSISVIANGVTFASSGTFTSIGSQNIVLTATGTPTDTGTHSFVLNTTPNCSFSRTTVVQCGVTPVRFSYNGSLVTYGTVIGGAGKCWLDRNLGATQVATSNYDANSHGHLFQWGRGADGHQNKIQTNNTATRSVTNTPGHANFITTYSGVQDWRQTQTDNLWQGVNGINNPCPSGYRIPTITELTNERDTWIVSDGAINSPLKIPIYPGARDSYSNTISVNSGGCLWSSTVNGSGAQAIMLGNSSSGINAVGTMYRSNGYSVRCIQNY